HVSRLILARVLTPVYIFPSSRSNASTHRTKNAPSLRLRLSASLQPPRACLHYITDCERAAYYNGISLDPPALLYR
ncbi:hypothetical protein H0H92_007979, partial [Tricholoma furcatifolium]